MTPALATYNADPLTGTVQPHLPNRATTQSGATRQVIGEVLQADPTGVDHRVHRETLDTGPDPQVCERVHVLSQQTADKARRITVANETKYAEEMRAYWAKLPNQPTIDWPTGAQTYSLADTVGTLKPHVGDNVSFTFDPVMGTDDTLICRDDRPVIGGMIVQTCQLCTEQDPKPKKIDVHIEIDHANQLHLDITTDPEADENLADKLQTDLEPHAPRNVTHLARRDLGTLDELPPVATLGEDKRLHVRFQNISQPHIDTIGAEEKEEKLCSVQVMRRCHIPAVVKLLQSEKARLSDKQVQRAKELKRLAEEARTNLQETTEGLLPQEQEKIRAFEEIVELVGRHGVLWSEYSEDDIEQFLQENGIGYIAVDSSGEVIGVYLVMTDQDRIQEEIEKKGMKLLTESTVDEPIDDPNLNLSDRKNWLEFCKLLRDMKAALAPAFLVLDDYPGVGTKLREHAMYCLSDTEKSIVLEHVGQLSAVDGEEIFPRPQSSAIRLGEGVFRGHNVATGIEEKLDGFIRILRRWLVYFAKPAAESAKQHREKTTSNPEPINCIADTPDFTISPSSDSSEIEPKHPLVGNSVTITREGYETITAEVIDVDQDGKNLDLRISDGSKGRIVTIPIDPTQTITSRRPDLNGTITIANNALHAATSCVLRTAPKKSHLIDPLALLALILGIGIGMGIVAKFTSLSDNKPSTSTKRRSTKDGVETKRKADVDVKRDNEGNVTQIVYTDKGGTNHVIKGVYRASKTDDKDDSAVHVIIHFSPQDPKNRLTVGGLIETDTLRLAIIPYAKKKFIRVLWHNGEKHVFETFDELRKYSGKHPDLLKAILEHTQSPPAYDPRDVNKAIQANGHQETVRAQWIYVNRLFGKQQGLLRMLVRDLKKCRRKNDNSIAKVQNLPWKSLETSLHKRSNGPHKRKEKPRRNRVAYNRGGQGIKRPQPTNYS